MAEGLSTLTGQSYIVENKPGVGGLVGHQYVASARPDGKTLLLGAIGPLVIAPHLSKITYDPQKDLAPLTMAVIFPNVLVVSPSVGVWYTFMAPADTPKDIQEALNKNMVEVLKNPKTRGELSRHGMTPKPSTQDELRQFIAAESKRWGQLIKDRNIAAN